MPAAAWLHAGVGAEQNTMQLRTNGDTLCSKRAVTHRHTFVKICFVKAWFPGSLYCYLFIYLKFFFLFLDFFFFVPDREC